jgi:hypothetical protein
MTARQQALVNLLEFTTDIDVLTKTLRQFPWDAESTLAILTRRQLAKVLRRFQEGHLTSKELEAWANAIEGREDIDFESGYEDRLQETIYCLANPLLTEPLTKENVGKLLKAIESNL